METQVLVQGFRLSPQQKRLWTFQQQNAAYQAKCAVLLEGDLNIELLKKAFQTVVNRQEILRTRFQQTSIMPLPLQVVSEVGSISWSDINLSDMTEEQGEGVLNLFQEEASQFDDLEQGPLVQATLYTWSSQKHSLFISLPALCADIRTLENLVGEISHFYAACLGDEDPASGSEEVIQYLQYTEWQNELLEDEEDPAGREYWGRRRPSRITNLTLAGQKPPSLSSGFRPHWLSFGIADSLTSRLALLAAEQESSLELVLLAAWQSLFWRLGNRGATQVGVARAGRDYEGLGEALGLFVKYLPLETEMEEGERFTELVRQTTEAVRELEKWQEYFSWGPPGAAGEGEPYLGVMIPHRGLVNYLNWARQAYRVWEGGGAPVHSSLSFDLTVTSVFCPLLTGGRVELLAEAEGVEGSARR